MSRPASSWSPMTQLMASTNRSRYRMSAMPVENGRPRRLTSNHDGRGHDPVTVAGSSRSFVAVSILRLLPPSAHTSAASAGGQSRIVADHAPLPHVHVEELQDPTPRVLGGAGVVADAHHLQQGPQATVVVHESVTGPGVLLHVVIDAERRERPVEACRGASQLQVSATEAADDGAGAREQRLR